MAPLPDRGEWFISMNPAKAPCFLAALIFGQWLGFRIQNDDYAGAYSCDAKHRAVLKTSDMNGADVEDESNDLGLALAARFGHDILEVPTHSADRRL